jgi:regulator of replication initiation timing
VNELYATISKLENGFIGALADIAEIKKTLDGVLAENAELRMENEHLRDHIANAVPSDKSSHNAGKALQDLYDQGFHVCAELFGKHRENGEECMFCMELINR